MTRSLDSASDFALATSDPETRDAWEAALWADEHADESDIVMKDGT